MLFDTNPFQSIESEFLSIISPDIPYRQKITAVLEILSRVTRDQINSKLIISSTNYIIFNCWTSYRNRE